MEIQVTLTNLTPLFSAAPGASTISLDGTINPAGGGFPFTRTRSMKMVAQTMDGEMKTAYVPIIPSNTMRNLLRRSMLKNVLEPALKGSVQLSVGAYASIYSGSASGNPDGKPSSFDETVQIRNHPFLGLFGGGPRMLEGRLKVDSLYPVHTNASAIIGDGFESNLISGNILENIWTRRVDPFTRLTDNDDVELIGGGAGAVNEWINAWFINAAEKKEKPKAKTTPKKEEQDEDKIPRGLNAFNAHEVVIPGVRWVWRISVDRPSDAQIGMILTALAQLSNLRIAGGNSKDYGRFAINSIKVDGKDVWAHGSVDPSAAEYLYALAESLDGMTAEQFEIFAASSKKEDE